MTAAPLPLTTPITRARSSTAARWTSRVLFALGVLFLVFDVSIKLMGSPEAMESTVALGFEPHHVLTIGIIELVCLALFIVPRTAPIGALLFTGYLGGAIVTHLRVDSPLFSHTLFPLYVAAILWGALYLRDPRVRALFGGTR